MVRPTIYKELTGSQLGKIQNHLGLLTEDTKGQKALDPEKFLQLTKLSASEASKASGTSRQNFYRNTIPLKPSDKLTQRVFALVAATDIAFELFDRNAEETANWMMSANALLFGASPFEVCIRGDGEPLIKWLLDRAGLEGVTT